MKLLIGTQAYSFFKRQWWQLTSIANQIALSDCAVPDVTYRIHYFKDDRNIEILERMLKVFSPIINIEPILWYDKERFSLRAIVRSEDVKLSLREDYDSLLFLDPDIVLHPEVLARLSKYYNVCDSVVACGRVSVFHAEKLIAKEDYTKPIDDLLLKINDPSIRPLPSDRGAGFFQYVTTKALIDNNVTTYSDRKNDRSIFDPTKFSTRSEQTFRRNVGNVIFGEHLTRVWHMEHSRHQEFDCK